MLGRATSAFSLITIVVLVLCTLPLFVHAQTVDQALQAAVRTALLSDTRAAGMSPIDFDTMVNLLTKEAQKKGMTPHDIELRPEQLSSFLTLPAPLVVPSCDPQSYLCAVNTALGFTGGDMTIPIVLAITSALLLLIIGTMVAMRRKAHLERASLTAVSTTSR